MQIENPPTQNLVFYSQNHSLSHLSKVDAIKYGQKRFRFLTAITQPQRFPISTKELHIAEYTYLLPRSLVFPVE